MKTIENIYDEIASEAAIDSALNDLDLSGDSATKFKEDVVTTSVVGRLRVLAWLVATAMFGHIALWEVFRRETKDLALDGHFGTKRWWVAKALAFQYGSDLVHTTKDSYYAVNLPAQRIVKQAAVVESAYKVIIKAVKSGTGGWVKLSTVERTALQDYCDEIKPAGMKVEVRSVNPDKLRIVGKVVCDAKQGILNIEANVGVAVFDYIQTLDFNGVFSITKLRAAVLAVPGVVDIQLDEVAARVDGSDDWVNVVRIRTAFAGYMAIDSSYPLTETLEFVSSNV